MTPAAGLRRRAGGSRAAGRQARGKGLCTPRHRRVTTGPDALMQIPHDVMPATATPGQGRCRVTVQAMQVLSVNVARAEMRDINGRRVLTAIGKRPLAGAVEVGPLGLAGDEQADPAVHGGIAKAVYAYPQAHYAFWQTVRAQARVSLWDEPLPPGTLGENLTVDGLLEGDMFIGDRWHLPGGCVLAVSEPRMPCFKFAAAMGFAQAVKLMAQSGYCGSYLAVIEPGQIQAGEVAELLPGPREVNIRELFMAKMKRKTF